MFCRMTYRYKTSHINQLSYKLCNREFVIIVTFFQIFIAKCLKYIKFEDSLYFVSKRANLKHLFKQSFTLYHLDINIIPITLGSELVHLGNTHRRGNNNNFRLILIETPVNYRLAILLMFINGLAPRQPLNIGRQELIGPDALIKHLIML